MAEALGGGDVGGEVGILAMACTMTMPSAPAPPPARAGEKLVEYLRPHEQGR